MELKHFKISEFDSPDKKGSGVNMQSSTLELLEKARDIANIPFIINSGYRTKTHNKKVGGVNGSSHTKGYAVDLSCDDSVSRYDVISALLKAGFSRIGISEKFIHVDNDPDKPKEVIWTY